MHEDLLHPIGVSPHFMPPDGQEVQYDYPYSEIAGMLNMSTIPFKVHRNARHRKCDNEVIMNITASVDTYDMVLSTCMRRSWYYKGTAGY